MTFNVEIVLKGRDFAVTKALSVSHGEPASWDEQAVRDVLVEILRAIDRVEHPDAPSDRPIALRGFSWIVEPAGGEVVLAIEIPMGAAVAGPFAVPQSRLDDLVSRVLRTETQPFGHQTIH